MLENINEIKILYNSNFNKTEYDSEVESLTFDKFKLIANFIGNNFKAKGSLDTISFIGDQLFKNFDNNLLPIIEFIQQQNKNYRIKFYFNNFEGDEKIFEELSKFSNIKFVYNLGYKEDFIPEENLNLILNYFPLSAFNYFITSKNFNENLIKNVWDYYSKYNLFYFNFEFEYQDLYSKEFFNNLNKSLDKIDLDIIEQIRQYSLTTIPVNYKYMLWKIGALNYCRKNPNEQIILPEQMCAYKCGYGCYKNLIIDQNGQIYSCYKIFNAPVIDQEFFHIGNINNGINEEKIENLITNSIDYLNVHKDKVIFNNSERYICSDCKLQNICTRGCPTINYLQHHNLFSHSQSFCNINLIFYNHAFELIKFFEASKNNSLFKDLFTGAVKLGEKNYEC